MCKNTQQLNSLLIIHQFLFLLIKKGEKMSAISNYQLTLNECEVNNDFRDLKLLEIESKF